LDIPRFAKSKTQSKGMHTIKRITILLEIVDFGYLKTRAFGACFFNTSVSVVQANLVPALLTR